MTRQEIHIFLASSKELAYDREQIMMLISQLQKSYGNKGIHIVLDQWENQDPAFKGVRTQDEYNYLIRRSNLFIALFHHKAGKYTQEEFDVAYSCCIRYKTPQICVYYKELEPDDEEERSLSEFKQRVITEMEYFTIPPYRHIDTLRLSIAIQIAFLISGNQSFESEIIDSQVFYNGIRIANLNEMPFSFNNPEIINSKEKLSSINEQILAASGKLEKEQAYLLKWENKYKMEQDEDFLENIQRSKESITLIQENIDKLLIEKDRVSNQIQEQNRCLMNVAVEINRCASKTSNELLRQATALFEQGKCKEAVKLLDSKTVNDNIENSKNEFKQAKDYYEASLNRLKTNFNILMLTAKSLLADKEDPNRFNKACEARKKAISIAKMYLSREEYCYLIYKYARFLDKNNRSRASLEFYKKAMNIYKEILNAEEGKSDVMSYLAKCYNRMGNVYNRLGNLKSAENYYNKSYELYKSLQRKLPEARYECKLMLIQNNLGVLYYKMGEKEYGQAIIKKQIEKYNRLPDDKKELYLLDIANCWINLGTFYRQNTRKDRQAKLYLLKALDSYTHLNVIYADRFESKIADCYYQLGLLFRETDFCQSETYLEKALQISLRLKELKPEVYYPKVAQIYESMGNLYFSYFDGVDTALIGRAIACYKTALTYYKVLEEIEKTDTQQNYGQHTANVGNLKFILGSLYKLEGQYETSIDYFQRCADVFNLLAALNKAYNHYIIRSYEEIAVMYGCMTDRNLKLSMLYFEKAIELSMIYYPSMERILQDEKEKITRFFGSQSFV